MWHIKNPKSENWPKGPTLRKVVIIDGYMFTNRDSIIAEQI